MKRCLCLLLSALMLSGCLAACSGGKTEETLPDAGSAAVGEPVPEDGEAETEAASDPLPDRDFGGADVTALIRTEWAYEFLPDEGGSDAMVSEAIAERNNRVEEKYNVRLKFEDTRGDWGNKDNFINAVHNSVLAGDGAYDFVSGYQATIVQNVTMGDFLNLLELPYIDLSSAWWTRKGVDALTVNNRCFIATGDITVTMLEYLYCMYWQKELAAANGLPDLYALVDSGKWTHDKLKELIAGTSLDVNGDGSMTDADRFGLIAGGDYLRQYLVAYDTPVVSVKADGTPYLSWNTEHTVSVVESLVSLYNNSGETFISSDKTLLTGLFRNGQALFAAGLFGQAAAMRDMEADFGIIPYPKFDEAQADYLTSTNNNVSMICVPVTCGDTDAAAFVIEALCRESTDTVSAAFYDTALKSKYARDDDSARMIDLIRGSLSFDFGWVYSTVLNLGNSYQMFVEENNTDFASYYASRENEYNAGLENIRATYFD